MRQQLSEASVSSSQHARPFAVALILTAGCACGAGRAGAGLLANPPPSPTCLCWYLGRWPGPVPALLVPGFASPSKLCQPNQSQDDAVLEAANAAARMQRAELEAAARMRAELEAAARVQRTELEAAARMRAELEAAARVQRTELEAAQTAGAVSAMAQRIPGGNLKHAFFAFQEGRGGRWDPFMLSPVLADAHNSKISSPGHIVQDIALSKAHFKSKGGQALSRPVYSQARWDALKVQLEAHGYRTGCFWSIDPASPTSRVEVICIQW
jgi:hypothetical protein